MISYHLECLGGALLWAHIRFVLFHVVTEFMAACVISINRNISLVVTAFLTRSECHEGMVEIVDTSTVKPDNIRMLGSWVPGSTHISIDRAMNPDAR